MACKRAARASASGAGVSVTAVLVLLVVVVAVNSVLLVRVGIIGDVGGDTTGEVTPSEVATIGMGERGSIVTVVVVAAVPVVGSGEERVGDVEEV